MPEELAKILIVDDDEDITVTICEYFNSQKLGIHPIATSDPRKVLQILEQHQDIRLILSDFRMPGMNGFDLLILVKSKYPQILFVIMTGYSTQELRREGLKRGAIRYIEKPFDLAELSDIVRDALQGSAGFGGVIEAIQLPDIIQLIGVSRRTVTLVITADQGKAVIHFEDGEATHAVCGDLVGEDAFHEVFKWTGGRFNFTTPTDKAEHTITRSWQGLLIEAARRMDEGAASEAGMGSSSLETGNGPQRRETTAFDELLSEPAAALMIETDTALHGFEALEPNPATPSLNGDLIIQTAIPKPIPHPAPPPIPKIAPARTGAVKPKSEPQDADFSKIKDQWLGTALGRAVEAYLAWWPPDRPSIRFGDNNLGHLPPPLRLHFSYQSRLILKEMFKLENAPFDFGGEEVSRALDGLTQALIKNWQLSRDFYHQTIRDAVYFEAVRSLDPVRALVELLQQPSGATAAEIKSLLQALIENQLIEDHFRALIEDLGKQEERRIHPRQMEYLARAILYRRDEAEGYRSMRQAMSNLLQMISIGQSGSNEGLPADIIIAMLEAHGLVQIADFLKIEGYNQSNSINLEELEGLWRRYLGSLVAA